MRAFWLMAAFLIGLVFTATGAQAGAGHVYLLKGLANVFSAGLDNYAAELAARGIPVTVANHSDAAGLAVEAAQLYKTGRGPIIIVGHSLGGEASTTMANIMAQRGARVALIVNYGPPGTQVIPANVDRVMNYYGSVGGLAVRGPGSRASIVNVDTTGNPEINHFNMDKLPSLQRRTIGQILAIVHGGGGHHRPRAAPKTSAVVAPSTQASAAH
jgi:pimeloyl-ACP methyl ester carboxylesterase